MAESFRRVKRHILANMANAEAGPAGNLVMVTSPFSSISPKNSTVVKPGRSLMRHESATDSAGCLFSIATRLSSRSPASTTRNADYSASRV